MSRGGLMYEYLEDSIVFEYPVVKFINIKYEIVQLMSILLTLIR
jgi:hypothetical protein